jgi:tetratricopeptide (TPR) repeat protein
MTQGKARTTWIILAAILLAGAALRGSYLREIIRAPEFAAPLADPAFHDYWARALLSGVWTPPSKEQDPRIQEVPFQRPPGYPYFLAGAYALTQGSYLGARIVQMVLGLVSCVLAFFVGRVLFSRAVGFILAGFCASYWILIYFEGELHSPVLITALNLALVLALTVWAKRPKLHRAAVAGLLLGAGALVQANILLFAPVGAAWMALRGRTLTPRASRHAIAFLAACAVAIAPATIRNWIVAKDFVLISSNGAINFYIGNNEIADGVSVRIPDLQELALLSGWSWFSYDRIVNGLSLREGRPLKYSEASRLFTAKAIDFIRENPGKFVELCGKRAALFWGPGEVANNKAIQVDKEHSPTLKLLPGFPLALSLSLAGAGAFIWRRWRAPESMPTGVSAALIGIALFILTYFLSFVPFLASARFRAPLIPIFFVFGAYGLAHFAQEIRRRAWRKVALAGAAWVALFLFCRHSFFEAGPDEAWWHTDRASALAQEGKLEEAVQELEAALRVNPGFVDANVNLAGTLAELGRLDEAIAHYEEVLRHRPERADVRLRLGELLLRSQRAEDAVRELEEVARTHPDSPMAHFELGRAFIELKRDQEGIEALRRSLDLDPKQPAARVNVGIALARSGDHEGAIVEYRQAIASGEIDYRAHLHLANSLQTLGNSAEAEKEYKAAFQINSESLETPINLGNLYMTQKRYEDAAHWYSLAIGIDPRSMSARCNLAGALANQGQYDEAAKQLEAALRINPDHPIAKERMAVVRRLIETRGSTLGPVPQGN